MEQRPLRLGDHVDDYCPRERRITNHAIVAIVEDRIRQTRCTTCDAEHVFKGGKTPPRRTRRAAGQPESPVDNTGGQLVVPAPPAEVAAADTETVTETAAFSGPAQENEPAGASASADATESESPEAGSDNLWPANRQLIRAQLPRVEGEAPPPRPIPEFTMHRYNGRGGNPFRQGRGRQDWAPGYGGNGARGDRRQGQGDGFGGGGHGRAGRRRRGKKRPR